jgi:hypothetical protein
MYAFLNASAVSSATPFPQVMATTASVATEVTQYNAEGVVAYTLEITSQDAVVEECSLFSAGVYVTAKG